MALAVKRVGAENVVYSGSIILGWEDEVEIEIYDLTFLVRLVSESDSRPVIFEAVGQNALRLKLNNWNPLGTFTKIRVGTLWDNDLYLALYNSSGEKFHRLTFTFSTKGSA